MSDIRNSTRFMTKSHPQLTMAGGPRRGRRACVGWTFLILVAALLISTTSRVLGQAKFVSGLVPDWEQPYHYGAGSPNGGPGPDPIPNFANQWNAWCAPSSAANLAGHWTDARAVPVADTTPFDSIPFPGSTVGWGVGPSWQDYLADSNRPPVQMAAGPLPASPTDIGWYMDTNRGQPLDAGGGSMGGYFLNPANDIHVGTYLKDIRIGLQNFLNSRYSLSGSIFWRTGTQGIGYSNGVNAAGLPAQIHLSESNAFAEVMSEIDTNRTLILSFRYWTIVPSVFPDLPSQGLTNSESWHGGTYYVWGSTPGSNPTNAEDEVWNYSDYDTALGHAVTCVGYIPANDLDDPYRFTPQATDWVIVHDNWSTTPRNVIIPFDWNRWVANTTAVPWPTNAKFVNGLVPDWNQPYRYSPQSPNGGPGAVVPPPPPFGGVMQWSAWCAPSSAANLAGHWTDYHGAPVADTTPFAGSTVAWAAGASWQDYLADGSAARPPATNIVWLPPSPTDIGWYMDTNRGVPYDAGGGWMGGYFFGNLGHTGTYLKDIHVGLRNYLNSLYRTVGGCWQTGTEGKAFAAGLNPTGGVAQVHAGPASAFSEVEFEINRSHTLIISFKHWNIAGAGVPDLPPDGDSECDFGGSYYRFPYDPSPGGPNDEDEYWNMYATSNGLGHAVTAVGYIPKNDVLDQGPTLGIGPTDWVIVHDNWASTPRNVIIPFDWNRWVANTIAFPDPGFLQITKIELAAGTNSVINFNGMPGALHDLEWKSDITNSTWSCCVSDQAFCAGTMQVTNTVDSSVQQRFYRVKATY